MINIGVQVDDGADATLSELISVLTGAEATALNEVGGRAAQQAATGFHREYDAAGSWRKPGRGQGGSRFGADVAAGWHFLVADPTGAVIYNDADHYAFKVAGGTITAKRVDYLTIPMVPEAHGLRVATYVQETGRKLFRVKGKKALFESKGQGKGVRAVYALVKSVTQPPWPDAVPPEDVIGEAFSLAWLDELDRRIDTLL